MFHHLKLTQIIICLSFLSACGGSGGSGSLNSSSIDDIFPKGNQTGMPTSGLYLLVRSYTPDNLNLESKMTNGAGILADGRFAGVFKDHSFIVYTLTGDRTRLFADARLYDGEGMFLKALSSIGFSVFSEFEELNDSYGESMQIKTGGYDLVAKTSIDQGYSLEEARLLSNLTEFQQPFINLVGIWLAEDGASSFTIKSNGGFSGSDQDGCQWEGILTQPDLERNSYLANLTLTSCDKAGSYELFASFADSDGDELSHIFFNDNFASSNNWTKVQPQ
jgi:hypothetical protein